MKTNKANLFVGTYTNEDSRGIYKLVFDYETGLLDDLQLVAVAGNPSFLALHPSGNWLYAVSELKSADGKGHGAVSAYSIAPKTGELLFLNEQSSLGAGPCHISVDAEGKWVLVANYGGGNASVYPIEEGGVVGPSVSLVNHEGSSINPDRQGAPHAHSITLDPDNKRAIVADLGLDQLLSYDLNIDTGELSPANQPHSSTEAGAGPRHFAFHPDGKHAFVINELNSTIASLQYDPATGGFTILGTISTLPADFQGTSYCADIHVSPDGRFVYGSNRGHNSIVIARFDDTSGELEAIAFESTRGKTPRNFTLDPTGAFLLVANQNSNSVFVFRVNKETGLLTSTGQRTEVPTPVCLKFA
ncbi:MAG: lactonase family protein [Rhodothermales bacterium]